MLKVYVNTSFKGHYPVGVSAVVIASNDQEAAWLLENELAEHGLRQAISGDDMRLIASGKQKAFILQDGDY